MDAATLTAVISAGTAITVVALTNYFAKSREHEADWRRLKLELYREYIFALSGMVEGRNSLAAQERHSDAVNGLKLVAPPAVMRSLNAFIEYNSYSNPNKSLEHHDRLINDLIKTMRADLRPKFQRGDAELTFYLMGIPPQNT
ncbi:hypothetical protein F6V30_09485 [Oryzomonas sagensis]|uniref:Uncharacterized protein n=1 Tax=Oryzomonas sagensis TaxID=2603857 RepID=A0ABQ6TPP2_9BACT|nr:hypothetical protein [Oryzomonas sagensis]KAB0670375.1 hypothetical protein F6V30_09485 [Oryzomonas sagensis]